MYGWLDDQVVRLLQVGFRALVAAPSEWRRLFPAYVPTEARDGLHALAGKVTCAVANMHGTDVRPPLVTVDVSDAGTSELEALGHEGGDVQEDGRYAEMGLREAVTLRILAPTKEEVRALALAVRAIMLSSMGRFLDEWEYSAVRYLGTSPVSPVRDYFPEQFGGFQVVQTWGTMGAAYIPLINAPMGLEGEVFIARDTVTVPDGAGGTITGGGHGRDGGA